MKTIKASEFKARCLQLMDDVEETREPIVITKNGRPVSKLVPMTERPKSLFGFAREVMEITGDIESPIDVEWEAMVDPDRVVDPARHAGARVARDRRKPVGKRRSRHR